MALGDPTATLISLYVEGSRNIAYIEAAVGQHSEKPTCFAELIKQMFSNTPRVELFARLPRLGWGVWGNEVNPDTV